MDSNKENKSVRIKSKIPLPKAPLPPLPQIVMKRQQEVEKERHPLKTINWQTNNQITTGAVLKVENIHVKPKCPSKVDTRHVTVRQNTEDLDWNFQVFQNNTVKDSSVIIVSDEEDDVKYDIQGENYFVNNREKNCLGETKKAITPVLKSPLLEPSRVKNIKRSLKRPHSRELQGLSPKVKQDRGDERFKRRLEFPDLNTTQRRLQSPDVGGMYIHCLNRDYTENVFTYLLNIETKTLTPSIPTKIRACMINWLMNVNGPRGNPAVIQTAQWYFDALLTATEVQIDSLQLVGAACYWIAQKVHGPAHSSRRLVKASSGAFTTKNLLSAEKVVLYKLKFPPQPVVPQEFITYFSWCCDNCYSDEIEVAATFLCMAGMLVDKELCNEYPSVIAAAAVRNAVLLLGRQDGLVRLYMNSVYKAAERKTSSISTICGMQSKAVCVMSSPHFKYKAPLEHCDVAPHFLSKKIIHSVNELSLVKM